MANWYVSSVKFAAIAQWAASTAYSLGDYRRRLTGEASGTQRVFKCTTAGTSGGTEPSWNNSNNGTTNDGTVVWTQIAGQEAEQAAGDWKAAIGSLSSLNALSPSAGDIVYVAHDHAESFASSVSLNMAVMAICVDSNGATIPPTSVDLDNTATVSITGNNSFTFSGFSARGIKFQVGSGGSAASNQFSFNFDNYFEDCEFDSASTNAAAHIQIGASSTAGGFTDWSNCRVKFQNISQSVQLAFSELLWRDTSNPLVSGSAVPNSLLSLTSTNGARSPVTLRNMDLSAFTSLAAISNKGLFTAENCKLNSSVNLTSIISFKGDRNHFRLHNCDFGTSGNIGFNVVERSPYFTTLTDPLVFRTGGASDGVNSYSLKSTMASNADRLTTRSHTLNRLSKRYNLTGVARTFRVECLAHATLLPSRSKFFCEFFVLDDANTPVPGKYSTQADFLDVSAPDASTVKWTDGLPTRTNSLAVGIGTLYTVASNPDRAFLVTAGGTTAASEPAGYATAVDGSSITDGTASLKALYRIKFEVTATPQRAGVVFARPYFMAPLNSIIWIDPKIEVA